MLYESEKGNASIILTGDSMITRAMRPFREPQFSGLLDLLRNSDITVSNLEMLFHNYEMSWQYKGAASFQVSHPRNIEDLKWMGIDVVTTATNHAFDYGEVGFSTTLAIVKRWGSCRRVGGEILPNHGRQPISIRARDVSP